MPTPPILEIYVVWHPDDDRGSEVADWLTDHFHGPAFSGLAGGAVEVYRRSVGWNTPLGAPRPLPFMTALPSKLPTAQFTVVVPVLGRALARAVREIDEWRDYMVELFAADGELQCWWVTYIGHGGLPHASAGGRSDGFAAGGDSYPASDSPSQCSKIVGNACPGSWPGDRPTAPSRGWRSK